MVTPPGDGTRPRSIRLPSTKEGGKGSSQGRLAPEADVVFESEKRPAPCYRLLLVNARPEATAEEVGKALANVTSMLGELQVGRVRELEGQPGKQRSLSDQAGSEAEIGVSRRDPMSGDGEGIATAKRR